MGSSILIHKRLFSCDSLTSLRGCLLQNFQQLDDQAKTVICMKAMKLRKTSEVLKNIKNWVAQTNKSEKPRPFKGHNNKTSEELVNMVSEWSIENKKVLITNFPPVSKDGKQILYEENVCLATE